MSELQEYDGAGNGRVASRAGQATQIEQARAIAEVRAAVMIAMDRPRDRTGAIAEMREVCSIPALADRAFFRVPRGGQHVNGESIHLARELARCWGNIDYGVKELARDDAKGQSELVAFCWDLQTNARSEITFIVPHIRGRANTRLTGTQEIYENNASFAGRRLREAIFAVLPVWFKAEAAEICHKTLAGGGGKPLVQRIADMRETFEAIGITAAQLEQKRGRRIEDFLPEDVAGLRVVYGSIKRGEVTIAEEFPTEQPAAPLPPGSKLEAIEQAATDTNPPALPDAGEPQPPAGSKPNSPAGTDHSFEKGNHAGLGGPREPAGEPIDNAWLAAFAAVEPRAIDLSGDKFAWGEYADRLVEMCGQANAATRGALKVTRIEALQLMKRHDGDGWRRVMDALKGAANG